jgi:hypothetical protein
MAAVGIQSGAPSLGCILFLPQGRGNMNLDPRRPASIRIDISDEPKTSKWGAPRAMPIPDYQTLMLPLLRFTSDGAEHTTAQAAEMVADQFNLTDAERAENAS